MDEVGAPWKVSIRRTCAVLWAERSSEHHKAQRRSQAALAGRIKEVAEARVRCGHRRVHGLACGGRAGREGWEVHAKRVHRPCKGLGL